MSPEGFLGPDWDKGEVQFRLGVVGVLRRVAHIFRDSEILFESFLGVFGGPGCIWGDFVIVLTVSRAV